MVCGVTFFHQTWGTKHSSWYVRISSRSSLRLTLHTSCLPISCIFPDISYTNGSKKYLFQQWTQARMYKKMSPSPSSQSLCKFPHLILSEKSHKTKSLKGSKICDAMRFWKGIALNIIKHNLYLWQNTWVDSATYIKSKSNIITTPKEIRNVMQPWRPGWYFVRTMYSYSGWTDHIKVTSRLQHED